jgi:RHS repeat-associated protein
MYGPNTNTYESVDSATTPCFTIAYDANGNTLSDAQGRSFTWDFENRLTQAIVPGTNGGTTTFKYDPFGRRIQKSGPLGTTNYLYDGHNLIDELDNSGNVLARYTQGAGIDQPLSELRSGATSYYEQDALGTVTSLSNGAGALANTYTYDSFGKLSASTGSITNPFQYTGREFDQETGLLFNRARYFDPSAGRFLSEDPVGFWGGMNLYAYTRNSPVVLKDAFGYQGCNASQWAQSPGACAGPQDPNAPYQGPDGQWYNVPEWHPDPTPPVPDPDSGPTPPPSPDKPSTCPCEHDARYYAVDAEVQSEYDWARTKILLRMVGITVGLEGVEHEVPERYGRWIPGLDVILWGYDISELLELQRKAHEELERRLNCKD